MNANIIDFSRISNPIPSENIYWILSIAEAMTKICYLEVQWNKKLWLIWCMGLSVYRDFRKKRTDLVFDKIQANPILLQKSRQNFAVKGSLSFVHFRSRSAIIKIQGSRFYDFIIVGLVLIFQRHCL